jgi:hypothetical protein
MNKMQRSRIWCFVSFVYFILFLVFIKQDGTPAIFVLSCTHLRKIPTTRGKVSLVLVETVDKVFDVESTTSYMDMLNDSVLQGGDTGNASSDEFSAGGK